MLDLAHLIDSPERTTHEDRRIIPVRQEEKFLLVKMRRSALSFT